MTPNAAAAVLLAGRRTYVDGTRRLLARYLRRARVQQFERALKLHVRVQSTPAIGVLLPYRVLGHAQARLLHPDGAMDYVGPILQQRRADVFFDRVDDVTRIASDALVSAEHRLWQHGFGVADGDTAIGPFGWCHYDGELRLADTGSLSTRFAQLRHCLSTEVVEERWQRRLARLDGELRPLQRTASRVFGHSSIRRR